MSDLHSLSMDRNTARLLMGMRRLVKVEFGEEVHITDGDAADRFLDLAARSRNRSLQEMGQELQELLGLVASVQESQPESQVAEQPKVVYYRGVARPVTEEAAAAPGGGEVQATPPSAAEPAPPSPPRKMYRGRPVG